MILPIVIYLLFTWSILGTLIGYNLIYTDCTAKTTARVIGITPVEYDFCLSVFEYTTRYNNTLIGALPIKCSDLSDFEICYCQHYESHYTTNLSSYFPNDVAETLFYSGVWCSMILVLTCLYHRMTLVHEHKEYIPI